MSRRQQKSSHMKGMLRGTKNHEKLVTVGLELVQEQAGAVANLLEPAAQRVLSRACAPVPQLRRDAQPPLARSLRPAPSHRPRAPPSPHATIRGLQSPPRARRAARGARPVLPRSARRFCKPTSIAAMAAAVSSSAGSWAQSFFSTTPSVRENKAYIKNTLNRYRAIGEMNFARSPSIYRRESRPGRIAAGNVHQSLPSKWMTEWSMSCAIEVMLRWTCAD